MKEKKKGSLTTFGIIVVAILAIVMIVHYYRLLPNEPLHIRILEGAWRFVIVLFGSGLVPLALFLAFSAASYLASYVFHGSEKPDSYMDLFTKLSNPLVIIGFIASYIIVFLGL